MGSYAPPFALQDFSGGLNNKDEAYLIPNNQLADVQNAVLGRGFISKRNGFVRFTPTALSTPIGTIYDFYKTNGTREMLALSDKKLRVVNDSGAFSSVQGLAFNVIDSANTAWTAANANVTTSADSTDKKSGTASSKAIVTDAAPVGLLVYKNVTFSIANTKKISLWIKSSVNLSTADLEFILSTTTNGTTISVVFSIPALTKDSWRQVIFQVTSSATTIQSIAIRQKVDIGAFTFWVDEVQRGDVATPLTFKSDNAPMITYKDRMLNDSVIICDGGTLKHFVNGYVETVQEYTPSINEQTNPGLNDMKNLTTFRALALKKDRFFAAAHPEVKNRLSFCYRDPVLGYAMYDYWPSIYFIDMGDDSGDIVELKPFRDALIILCERTLWALKGDGGTINDYELIKVNVPSGCVSQRSVEIVGNEMFYLSDDHVYSLYSTDRDYVSASIVSQAVETTLKSISLADKRKAVGMFHDNKYYLSFPDGTTLVYDTMLKSWTKWTNVKANSLLDRDGTLFFSTSNGLIYKFDVNTYNDDGAAISFLMRTKNFDFGAPVQRKKIKRVWTIAKQYRAESSHYNIRVFVDYVELIANGVSTDVSGVWDEGDWDDVKWDFINVVKTRHRFKARGEYVQFEITNNNLNEPFTLYQIVIRFKVKKPK